ncbi:MAG: response regulator [Ruminococcaceae bacterium]|nr:response regulator [Oscillospiraceae bacterium]
MMKVVIADDEAKVCQLISGLVDWASLEMEIVGVAHNGIEALEMIETLRPDLMITDIRMPGYDGLEMIGRGKKIKEDIDFIIVSGYRHFEYAQSAIKYGVCDYLLKPIKKDALLDTLHRMREKYRQRTQQLSAEERLKIRLQSDISRLRSNLMTNLLLQRGGNSNGLQMEKLNHEYHFHFEPGYFQVFLVKIDCEYGILYESGMKVLEDKMKQILQGLLKAKCFDLEISFQESRAYCILNYGKDAKETLRRQLRAVMDELLVQNSVFEKVELTIGLGSAVENLNQLEDSLKAAEWAVSQRLVEGTGKMIETAGIPACPPVGGAPLAEFNKEIEAALEILDINAAASAVDSLKKQIQQIPQISGQEVFQLVTSACLNYLVLLKNHQFSDDREETLHEKFISRADLCSSVPQLFGYLLNFIQESMGTVIQDKKQAEKKPIRLAKQYIQQNYSKQISLEEVSSVAGFNASYFSVLFKKESGQNFMEYLSEVRMNKAKELFKETNLSVASICEQVGYSDIKHFTQGFKKFTGLKPNEFRKLYS